MDNNILKKLISILIIVVGFTWIIFFLFRYQIRLWLIHLDNIYISWSLKILLIITIVTIIHSLSKKFDVTPLRQLVKLVNDSILVFYWKPLEHVFDKVFKIIPGIGDILIAIGIFLQNRINVSHSIRNFAIFTSIIIAILPRILVCSIFFLNVMYTKCIFCSLTIPLISYMLLMRLLVFIIFDFGVHNVRILLLCLDITYLGKGKGYSIQVKPSYIEKHLDKLELYAFRYFLYRDMAAIANAIQNERDRLYEYIKKPLHIVYLIGLIKLILILFNILIPNEFYIVTLYICLLLWLFR
jgi:hypothetical protein